MGSCKNGRGHEDAQTFSQNAEGKVSEYFAVVCNKRFEFSDLIDKRDTHIASKKTDIMAMKYRLTSACVKTKMQRCSADCKQGKKAS